MIICYLPPIKGTRNSYWFLTFDGIHPFGYPFVCFFSERIVLEICKLIDVEYQNYPLFPLFQSFISRVFFLQKLPPPAMMLVPRDFTSLSVVLKKHRSQATSPGKDKEGHGFELVGIFYDMLGYKVGPLGSLQNWSFKRHINGLMNG